MHFKHLYQRFHVNPLHKYIVAQITRLLCVYFKMVDCERVH